MLAFISSPHFNKGGVTLGKYLPSLAIMLFFGLMQREHNDLTIDPVCSQSNTLP
jgi:hypothetical protein